MADNRVVDISKLESDLTSIGNAIRGKTGGTGKLSFPSGMISAIAGISAGSSGLEYTTGVYTPTSDVNKFTITYSLSKAPSLFIIWTDSPETLPTPTVSTHVYAAWCLYFLNPINAGSLVGYNNLFGLANAINGTWAVGAGSQTTSQTSSTKTTMKASAIGQNVYRYLESKRAYKWIAICGE